MPIITCEKGKSTKGGGAMRRLLTIILLICFLFPSVSFGNDKKEFENTLLKAKQGEAYAQFTLGYMYQFGKGITQNYKNAAHWYQKAAEQGLASAQHNLANRHVNGEGVANDCKQAYIWESLAAAQGHKSAIKNRDIIAKKLTPQQLAEAQEEAVKLQKKIDSSLKTNITGDVDYKIVNDKKK